MNRRPITKHLLSKSTFMYGVQCTKRVWLNKNLPKERDIRTAVQNRIFQQGTDVGLLAQRLFPGGVNAEPENYYSYQKSVADTMRFIRSGHQIIYEAAFQFDGILCALDMLVKINFKWYAYEVKSTNGVKDAHIYDAALQYYVITNSGIALEDFSIIHLNKHYVRNGDLDIHQLFQSVSVLKEVQELQPFISSKSIELLGVLSRNKPPEVVVGDHCNTPYPCDFQGFCNKGVLPDEKYAKELLIDQNKYGSFARSLRYPVCYLSVHTWSSPIPLFTGHSPYKQVCFQFSLHKQQGPGEPLKYFHFLEEGMNSQQKEFIELLLLAVGDKGSVVSHCGSFLKYHLQELKKCFTGLEVEISSLQNRVVELPEPFRVDFNSMQMLNANPVDAQKMTNNSFSRNFIISDYSSAAAAYFNLPGEEDKRKIEDVREALSVYSEKSTLNMARLIDYLVM